MNYAHSAVQHTCSHDRRCRSTSVHSFLLFFRQTEQNATRNWAELATIFITPYLVSSCFFGKKSTLVWECQREKRWPRRESRIVSFERLHCNGARSFPRDSIGGYRRSWATIFSQRECFYSITRHAVASYEVCCVRKNDHLYGLIVLTNLADTGKWLFRRFMCF